MVELHTRKKQLDVFRQESESDSEWEELPAPSLPIYTKKLCRFKGKALFQGEKKNTFLLHLSSRAKLERYVFVGDGCVYCFSAPERITKLHCFVAQSRNHLYLLDYDKQIRIPKRNVNKVTSWKCFKEDDMSMNTYVNTTKLESVHVVYNTILPSSPPHLPSPRERCVVM